MCGFFFVVFFFSVMCFVFFKKRHLPTQYSQTLLQGAASVSDWRVRDGQKPCSKPGRPSLIPVLFHRGWRRLMGGRGSVCWFI